jgi:hypothetical protein
MGAFQNMRWLDRLKRPLAGAAAWAAFGLGAAAPVALAQSPPVKGVEVWYGMERVSTGKEAAPPQGEPAAARPGLAMPAPGVYVLPAAGYPFTPTTPPALLPGAAPFLPDAGRSTAPAPKPSAVVPTAHWSEDRAGSHFDSAIHDEARTKTHAEAPRRPAPRPEPKPEKPAAAAPVPAAPVVTAHAHESPEGTAERSDGFLYRVVLVQLLGVVGSLVVGPLVLLLALLVVLRRFKGTGSLLRVEVVNSGTPAPTIVYGGPAAWPAPVPAAGGDGAAEVRLPSGFEAITAAVETKEPEVESTAQPFDLGPTYEEERLQREEAERQRELAVLQHVFEDNVRLREELGQLAGADAGAAGDVREAVPTLE